MQFSTILAILAPVAVVPVVRAGCYSGGETLDDAGKAAARGVIEAQCNGNSISGSFNGGQSKTFCGQLNPTTKVDLQVQWTGAGTLTLNDADCTLRLENEINGCASGGEDTTAGWFFKADPNNGVC